MKAWLYYRLSRDEDKELNSLVKDLSRLGRHRTQTALFIDYLREHNVRVLSATENIDTFNEADDLIIGFKGLVNDFYARDGSRRVRTGYRQKQKEGIVMIPPFGYFKDKNTKQVVIVEEAAETVRMIFTAYIGGHGLPRDLGAGAGTAGGTKGAKCPGRI